MYATHAGEQFTLYALRYEVAVALQKILFIYVNALQISYLRATFARRWHAGWTSTPSISYAESLPISGAVRVMYSSCH
jgi:hypothetical protein